MEIPEYRFELWPGYQTSIRQHEHDVLMGVEITHKVMRQENLLDILGRVRSNARGGDIQVSLIRSFLFLNNFFLWFYLQLNVILLLFY